MYNASNSSSQSNNVLLWMIKQQSNTAVLVNTEVICLKALVLCPSETYPSCIPTENNFTKYNVKISFLSPSPTSSSPPTAWSSELLLSHSLDWCHCDISDCSVTDITPSCLTQWITGNLKSHLQMGFTFWKWSRHYDISVDLSKWPLTSLKLLWCILMQAREKYSSLALHSLESCY